MTVARGADQTIGRPFQRPCPAVRSPFRISTTPRHHGGPNMARLPRLVGVASMIAAAAGAACSTAVQQSAHTSVQTGAPTRAMTPAEQARLDSGRMPFTAADVKFMQGMIHHHAQAVVMAGWAQTHGARPDVKILAQRIDVAQRDEIAFMQRWLKERGQTVPEPMEMQPGMPGLPAMPDRVV